MKWGSPIVNIRVIGAQQTVTIEIISDEEEIIEELSFPSSDEGKIVQPWVIPPGTEPGEYIFRVEDAYDSAETTFQIN